MKEDCQYIEVAAGCWYSSCNRSQSTATRMTACFGKGHAHFGKDLFSVPLLPNRNRRREHQKAHQQRSIFCRSLRRFLEKTRPAQRGTASKVLLLLRLADNFLATEKPKRQPLIWWSFCSAGSNSSGAVAGHAVVEVRGTCTAVWLCCCLLGPLIPFSAVVVVVTVTGVSQKRPRGSIVVL